uniref:Epidermal patterning factor-like protein n=1 Tax=Fagus sylvatica TaxID=28930 RepID=A0A2N9H1N0_FAGSY
MGSTENCLCRKQNRHLLISLLLALLVSSLTQVRFMAEGRGLPNLVEAAQKGIEENKVAQMVRTQIGSRPPRCERRCSSCGHCEAVQVPIVPLVQTHRRSQFSGVRATPTVEYSRGDGISNYKPMCWKCKCGDLFFNP